MKKSIQKKPSALKIVAPQKRERVLTAEGRRRLREQSKEKKK